jgi:uncharacterized membrane protein
MKTILLVILALLLIEVLALMVVFVFYMISRIREKINHRRIQQWTLH